jgi:hypothetical protein
LQDRSTYCGVEGRNLFAGGCGERIQPNAMKVCSSFPEDNTVSKARSCATLYAIFEIGVQLTEITLLSEECDV